MAPAARRRRGPIESALEGISDGWSSLRWTWLAAVVVGLAGAAPRDETPLSRQVGSRVGDFTLKDATTGRDVSLSSFQGKKASVLVFLGTECPVGNQYLPRLAEIAKAYEPKGVVVLGINSNAHETPEQIAAHAREFAIPFPILKDGDARMADQYQAQRTCVVILLDDKAVVRYRGAIDDQYGYGTRRPKVVKSYLTDALDTLLAGKPIETTGTSVVGCPIERADRKVSTLNIPKVRPAATAIVEALKDEPEVKVGAVTYASDVAPILQNKCQNCHRPKAAALLLAVLRRRPTVGGVDPGSCRGSADAAVARRPALWPLRERSPAIS